MTTIQLSDQTAAALAAQAALLGLDVSSYLERIAGLQPSQPARTDDLAVWLKGWEELVASMPGSLRGVDDSRESIYDDRS